MFFANNQRPPNIMTACFVAHSHILSTLSKCLESLRNRTLSNLKLDYISKNPSKNCFGRKIPPPGTPKHNDKFGTDRRDITEILLSGVQHQNHNPLPIR
jgi:hypothetical protein